LRKQEAVGGNAQAGVVMKAAPAAAWQVKRCTSPGGWRDCQPGSRPKPRKNYTA